MSKETKDQLPGQLSIFDYLGCSGTEEAAGSGTAEPDPWRATAPSNRKLNKAVKDAKKTLRGLRETLGKSTNKKCRTCAHMRRSVYGFMEYHGFACFGFGISKSQDIEKKACEDYTPATDGEAWRTSEKAANAWLEEEGEERVT